MLSYEIYKFIHLIGLALLAFCLGAFCLQMLSGRSRDFTHRKLLTIGHGVALTLMLVAGFGMMARLGIVGTWPKWIVIKVAVFLILGGIIAIMRRKPEWNKWLGAVVIALIGVAAYSAIFKPLL